MNLNDAKIVISAGLALLPPRLDTLNARAMLLAIGLQESGFVHRRQISGPARGFWQFELGGARGVMTHRSTSAIARDLLMRLSIPVTVEAAHATLEFNDLLAVGFARLNLLWLPGALPGPDDGAEGWRQYIEAWRPGKPHVGTWPKWYSTAWEALQ